MKKTIILLLLVLFLMLSLPQFALADTKNEYDVIPGKIYLVLRAELLSSDGLLIHRIYDEYNGLSGRLDYKGSLSYGKTTGNKQYDISLPKSFPSLNKAKAWLLANDPNRLQLLPNTIVSEEVLNEWSKNRYWPQKEYWEHSPQGLVSYDLQADYSYIPKPYLIEGLSSPEEKSIQIFINNTLVKFGIDKPYIIDDSIVLPITSLASKLGFKHTYSVNEDCIGILTLEKGPRKIELSPWLKHVKINGLKTYFNAQPRLSIHEKILAPVDLLTFMAQQVRWQELDGIIRLYITC